MLALCLESSHARGMGHLFRALNLADALLAANLPYRLYVNDHAASLAIIAQRGHPFAVVPVTDTQSGWEDALIAADAPKLWINDRLDTDSRHSQRIKAHGLKLVTFDDRGSGAAAADLHIAALAADPSENLAGGTVLRGVEYLILTPEIAQHRRTRTTVDSILVTLGGSDTYGATIKVLAMLAAQHKTATVVIGPAFAHRGALDALLKHHPGFTVITHAPSLVAEFARHDLAITGGGITAFEAAASGLPTIIVANELHEIAPARLLERFGCSAFAGHHEAIDASVLARPLPIESMSRTGQQRVPADGVKNVVAAIRALGGV